MNRAWAWAAGFFVVTGVTLCLCTYGRDAWRDARREAKRQAIEKLSDVSQEQLDTIAARVRPMVEDVAGASFKSVPVVRVVKRSQLSDALARDVDELSKRRGAMEPDLEAALENLPYIMSMEQACLGKYFLTSRAVLIVPENFAHVLAAHDVDLPSMDPFLTLLVAHEMTHALQDQVQGLEEKLAGCNSPEACSAWNAVLEGQAMVVEREIARGDPGGFR